MPRHIIIKPLKAKDRENILKATRGNSHPTCRGKAIRTRADFFIRNHRDQKKVLGHFSSAEREELQPRILHTTKISCKIKTFLSKRNEGKLREFFTSRPII